MNSVPEERREQILTWQREDQLLRIDDLVQRLGVSNMTIHRDLDALAEMGRVIAASLTGLALPGGGGFFMGQTRPSRWLGGGGLAVLCLLVGILFLGAGALTYMGGAPMLG